MFITVNVTEDTSVKIALNKPVLEGYLAALKSIASDYGVRDDISVTALSRMPDVFVIEKQEEDEQKLTEDILSVVKEALAKFNAMREKEGAAMEADLRSRAKTVLALVEKVEARSPVTLAEYRARLTEKMQEVLGATNIDESRILQEAAVYADKIAVDEETVRLRSHLNQLDQMLTAGGPIGRKLDFLLQEFNRESHTIGSKGNDLEQARTVVDHVSIDVNQGEIVGLLGPNGAGKTTTFYMIVGLIKPNEGRIFLEDDEGKVAELTKEPVYKRAQMGVGYLAQEASVFRRLSVEDNIRAVLEMTDFSKEYQNERVESLIEEFRLQKVRKSLGIQLSGGERRRTEIARAVAINPAFILLDEPFAGVDPIAVEDIQSIVATLKHKNIGVIITDHNVDETLAITDRTYLLYEGKILKTGTAEELAADPMVRKVYLGQHFELKKSHQLTQQMKNRKGQQAQQAGEETETQE